jgi:lipopolysaccharide export system protein LptC
LIVRQYNSDGHLTHFLKTSKMQHTPYQNTHYLTNPHIIVQNSDQKPWNIRSKYAQALYNGKQITFSKQVVIHQNKTDTTQETHLATEELTYFPESKFATTLKQVEFTQAGSIVTSIGMNAFLENNRIQLLSHAQGNYAPTQG